MKSLKKLIAIIAIIAMTIASTIVNAAPLDNATANVTLDWLTWNDTLVVDNITSASGSFNYVEIIDNAWTSVYTWSTFDTNTSTGFSITSVNFDTVLNNSTRYSISFTTANGDFGAAVLVVNQDNRLTVTATVQPVLKFAIEANTADFGVLSTTTGSISKWVEVWTNAINWVTVTVQTVNGWLKSTTASGHTIWLNTNDSLYADEVYSFSSILWTADSASWASITGLSTTDVVAANDTFTIYTANMPQNFNTTGDYDTDFTVSAKISESTPSASDYTDVIIFTATANF